MPLNPTPPDIRYEQFPVNSRKNVICFGTPTSVGQGTFSTVAGAGYYFGGARFAASPANGDNFSFSFFALPGTYTLDLYLGKFSDCAILEALLDSVSLGTTDCYNASLIATIATYTGQVLSTAGSHSLTFKANGKNASSSNYNLRASAFSVTRTA